MQVVAHLAVKEQLRPVERPLVDEAAFLKHPARSGIENRRPKSKAKVKGVLLLELFGSLIPKII